MTSAVSLGKFRNELNRRGFTRKATGRVLGELAIHVAFMLGGSAIFFLTHGPYLAVLGGFICGLACLGIATNTHTSSHQGTSRSRRFNDFLTYLGYPFLNGFSSTYWWWDHVGGHHVAPNVEGHDDDFDYAPLFAITEKTLNESSGLKRWYYRSFQTVLLFAVMPFLGINLQKNGFRHLIGVLKSGENRKKAIVDLALLFTHIALFLVVPAMIWGIGASISLYLIRMAVMSVCLFVILVPAHFVREAPVLTAEEAATLDYCQLQTMTTVNVDGGWLLRWYSSGLDYQIEHHLFPDLSHSNYPRIQPLVRQFCEDNGLPYRVLSLWDAMAGSLGVFRKPKAVGLDAVPELAPLVSEAK